jgi:PhnB protein
MAQLHPYLQFGGNCREAMTFYQTCLGGELWVQTFGESPAAQDTPAALHDRVLHAQLGGGAMVLMGSDGMGEAAPASGGPVTLALVSEDKAEVTDAFNKLAVGGTVTQPLIEAFFGLFGMLTDQYGMNWMFQGGTAPSA